MLEPSFVSRMITERNEVLNRIEALLDFMNSDEFSKIGSPMANLMEEQLEHMKGYASSLRDRLEYYSELR